MNKFQKIINKVKNRFTKNTNKESLPDRSMKKQTKESGFLGKMIKKVGYSLKSNLRKWKRPDFDLYEVAEAYDTDSYVRQAIDKYVELMFKQGWQISYRDKEVKDYLKKRMVMIGDQMGTPFDHFLKQISDDLVKYHNVFIAKKRKKADNQPNIPGVDINPIQNNRYPVATYSRLAPQTMRIKTDEHGTIKKYKQVVGGKTKEFNKKNIIHIAFKKPAGKFFGVPFALPALDDVRVLREMEDNVSKLLYRHLYPLFVYEIGENEPVFEETEEDEIERMKYKIENMPIDGGLVIPGQHNIDLLSVDENIGAEKFLEYFEKRVFTGLGVSETLMGRGGTANRSTAETQASEMRDKVKAFQTVIENYLNMIMLRELLMEGGYDPILNKDDKALFKFNEIDVDLLIKRENHVVYKFEHNAITHSEMREELSNEPLSEEEQKGLFGYMFSDAEKEKMMESDSSDDRSDDEGDNNHNENTTVNYTPIHEEKILEFTGDFQSETLEIISSYNKENITEDEAKDLISDMYENYSQKVFYYLKASYKSYIDFDEEDEARVREEFDKFMASNKELLFKIFHFKDLTRNKAKARLEHIKSLVIEMYRETIKQSKHLNNQ